MPDASALQLLGIIAGSGRLPLRLVEACQSGKRPFFVLALDQYADISALAGVPHATVRLGAIGEALSLLHKAGVKDLVLAGSVRRPSFASLRPDLGGMRFMARLSKAFLGGDDTLLKTIVAMLEEEGFKVVGSKDVLSEVITPSGQLGKIAADNRSTSDIIYGLSVVKRLGELDVGQAAIVENGYVLGVEAAEGTDALIERCTSLKRESNGGVLVKMCKPGQEKRVDLPAIGITTIEKIAAAGFRGVAVEAAASIILDKERVIARADELGIFVIGIEHG